MGLVSHIPLIQHGRGAQPAHIDGYHIVDGGVHHNGVNGIVHDGRAEGVGRHRHNLTAHAHQHIGGGDHPVQIGQTRGHGFTRPPHTFSTPCLIQGSRRAVGHLKLYAAGQRFAGDDVEVDTNTLGGIEAACPVFRIFNKRCLAEQIIGEGERGPPFAGHLDVRGGRAVGGGNHHARGEEEIKELFHDAHPQ